MERPYAIFDMDGTLVDSMPYWARLTREYLEQQALSSEEILELEERVETLSLRESAALFQRALGLDRSAEEVALEMGDLMDRHYQRDIPLRTGVKDYLEKLRQEGAVLCVVTLTPTPLAWDCLARLGIADYFAFVLSADDAGTGKDDPQIFLQAAWQLGAHPAECAVFEDSHYAARSAREAGCFVVGIYEKTHGEQWPRMKQICDVTVHNWAEALEFL